MTVVTTPSSGGKDRPIYEFAVEELHRISTDEEARRTTEEDLNEARGRDGARLHVILRAIAEVDRRARENTRTALEAVDRLAENVEARTKELDELVRSIQEADETRYGDLQEGLRRHATDLQEVRNALAEQIDETRSALWTQAEGSLQSVQGQMRESTERLAVDVRKLRDEVISLVDSRFNQADASFAALRGDVEVVKYLVMDLIKDRVGRIDPKSKDY